MSRLNAAITTDGTLDASYGAPVVTQINISNSHAGGSGPSDTEGDPLARPGVEGATPAYNPVANGYTQLSNAYAVIDSSNTLHLFFGGSLDLYDSQLDVAIQSNATGVSSLAGIPSLGSGQSAITFDTGFKPNALLKFNPTYNGTNPNGSQDTQIGNIQYNNLATKASQTAATFVTAANNNALVHTLIGAGGTGDPGFAGATTGTEMAIPLASLGAYTTGTPVEVTAFVLENSLNAVDNQVLSPYSYFNDGGGNLTTSMSTTTDGSGTVVSTGTPIDTSGRVDTNDDDYTFTGANQFTSAAFPGMQYFTVAVPEPTTLGLLSLAAVPMLRRRKA